jgi:hypothetical protein
MSTLPITLHAVKRAHGRRSNRYCGPSLISILTGLDTRDTARLLREVSGRSSIKGTSSEHIRRALSRLGIDLVSFPTHRIQLRTGTKAVTFVQWERASRAVRGSDAILLVMGNHWAVVQGRRYACGMVRKPVPFSAVPHRCARVTEAYRLIRTATGKRFTSLVPPAPASAPDLARPVRERAKQLASTYGIQIEDSTDWGSKAWNVWAPPRCYEADGLWPDAEGDPLSGERFCDSWDEVLEAVKVYADAIEASRTPGQGQVAAAPAPVAPAPLPPQPTPYRFEVENGCGDICAVLLSVKPGRQPQTYKGCAIIKVRSQGPIANEAPWRVNAFWPEGNETAKVVLSTD